MFIPELDKYDQRRAVGILSRMVLDLESEGLNPAAAPLDDTENLLRTSILQRAKQHVLNEDFDGQYAEHEIQHKLIEFLDHEADARSEQVDQVEVLARLSNAGYLPSDQLKVSFNRSLAKYVMPNLEFDDNQLSVRAVHKPDMQISDPKLNEIVIKNISIFGKWYNFGSSKDKFLLVVCGYREASTFYVSYHLRIYEEDVNLFAVSSPLEALARFADKFAITISIGSWAGKFVRSIRVYPGAVRPEFALKQHQTQIVVDGEAIIVDQVSREKSPNAVSGMFLLHNRDDEKYLVAGLALDKSRYDRYVSKHLKKEKFVLHSDVMHTISRFIK